VATPLPVEPVTDKPASHSWQPLDLIELGSVKPQPADLGGLLYCGKRHVVSGEDDAGKTMLLLGISADELRAGHGVVWIDTDEMGAEHGARAAARLRRRRREDPRALRLTAPRGGAERRRLRRRRRADRGAEGSPARQRRLQRNARPARLQPKFDRADRRSASRMTSATCAKPMTIAASKESPASRTVESAAGAPRDIRGAYSIERGDIPPPFSSDAPLLIYEHVSAPEDLGDAPYELVIR
jgi:hypothetical protein